MLEIQDNTVVVAMSGGVDSSVSAYLLHSQGQDSVGVSMQVWDYRNHGGSGTKATCCSPDDFTDARKVAAKIGIPYYVMDLEEYFRHEVINKFVESYRAGITPNPCVDCNRRVKFRELRRRATNLGCKKVATGHYARIRTSDDGYHLLRGVDKEKDQSYFLYATNQDELSHTIFPVGDLTKSEVRQIAREQGLVTAEKPESQDICFVSGSVGDFIAKIGHGSKRGYILNADNKILGSHDGIHNFTVGQRKGLGIGGNASPLYVIEIRAEDGAVIVGERELLERRDFQILDLHLVSPTILKAKTRSIEGFAQLRHRHPGVKVKVDIDYESSTAHATFLDDWTTVTPGQAAVIYDLQNEEVLCGGTIKGLS